MALQIPRQPPRSKAGPPPGLKNLGNTCYLNSVLQCLAYTPPLAQFCLSSQHSSLCKSVISNRDKECPFCILERQIARLLSLDGALDSPAKILNRLTLFAEQFRWGRQEDAHEFLRYVIDACHSTCLKLLKCHAGAAGAGKEAGTGAEGPSTVMKDIFGGALLSQVKCLSCKGDSNKTDEIMDISLDVLQSNSLDDALARFFHSELLDGNNKYNCGKCKKLSVARKQMFILRAPNVLVIQLKRFEGIHGGKVNRSIQFEEVLVLSRFMYNTTQDLQPEYNLFGSIVHSGLSPESGHYYAYIKDASGRWYCCNDAHVSLSSAQEVLSEKVYVLFYLLSNQSLKNSSNNGNTCSTMKPPGCNGTDTSPNYKTPEFLKKQNGVYSSKYNASSVLNNGKITKNPQIKQINLKSFEITRVVSNGKDNHGVKNNAVINMNDASMELVSSVESKTVGKAELPATQIANGIALSALMEENNQNVLSFANGNGCANHLQEAHVNDDTTTGIHAKGETDFSSSSIVKESNSCVLTQKRKLCDYDSAKDLVVPVDSDRSKNVAYREAQSTSGRHSWEDLEKLKDVLVDDASVGLRSSNWVRDVHNFMRAKKRMCLQEADGCIDSVQLREQMIGDAKRAFISQIPESLKGRLIERLRSFYQMKPSPDA